MHDIWCITSATAHAPCVIGAVLVHGVDVDVCGVTMSVIVSREEAMDAISKPVLDTLVNDIRKIEFL